MDLPHLVLIDQLVEGGFLADTVEVLACDPRKPVPGPLSRRTVVVPMIASIRLISGSVLSCSVVSNCGRRNGCRGEVKNRASALAERLLAIFDVFGEWFATPHFEGCAFPNIMLEFDDFRVR
ncbi:MAG: hypothetical protein LC799_01585 [Actinobacteria bacterium]|nr:hypothetical protein [Actinomycetota bacterium]